jgi:hypothetical protein
MTATTGKLETNKNLARGWIDQVFNQRDQDKAADRAAGSRAA